MRERAKVTVRGNHDDALVTGGHGFSPVARAAIDWTRTILQPGFFSGAQVRRRWEWLTTLPEKHEAGPDLFLHGSPRDPVSEYVLAFELPLWGPDRYEETFAPFDRFLFVGHTHLPCVIDDQLEARTSASLANRWKYPGKGKAIVNVGSVGQPRDQDARACYVLQDDAEIEWRRVPYDVESARKRFSGIADLHPKLAERLKIGA